MASNQGIEADSKLEPARKDHAESVESASAGTLIRELATTLRDLWSKELELARAETREGIDALRHAAACVLLAAVPAVVALVLMALAITYALDDFLPQWAAALLPAIALAAISAAMLFFGFKRLNSPEAVPDETVRSLKKDKQWLKQQLNGET